MARLGTTASSDGSLLAGASNRIRRRRRAAFFSPVGRRRASTLFPYTTLFRSRAHTRRRQRARHRRVRFACRSAGGAQARDRKSTRLNSSHGYISYAVFCLKKKRPLTPIFRLAPTSRHSSLRGRVPVAPPVPVA